MRSKQQLQTFARQQTLIQSPRWKNIVNKERINGDAASLPSLDKNAPPPDLAIILDFVRFHAATNKSVIDNGGLIIVESSNTFME